MHAITRIKSGIFKKLSIQIFRESYRLELTFLGGILAKTFFNGVITHHYIAYTIALFNKLLNKHKLLKIQNLTFSYLAID